MTNRKRVGALLMCLGMVLFLFVSSTFIAHEVGHDCSGEDCPICQMIAIHVILLRTLGFALLIALALFALRQVRSTRHGQRQQRLPASGTLVSWKIRLND